MKISFVFRDDLSRFALARVGAFAIAATGVAIVSGLAGQISLGIAIGCGVAIVALTIRNHGRAPDADAADQRGGAHVDVAWPDPETRPRF